jgi:ATP-dependent DNA helicase RecQ
MTEAGEAVDLEAVLAGRFGHEAFRPGQREAIEAVLAGRDVLLMLPTGAGKSLVYRLAAEVLPGFVLVISPLIALMRDQVESAREDGQAAERIDSTLGERRIEAALAGVEEGRVRLLYVTPERLENAAMTERLRAAGPALVVVDEAHVVSQWGHGFRPAYLELGRAIEALGRPPALAATATANPWVRREIVERLGLRDPLVVARASDRPNLVLEAVRVERARDELPALARLLDGEPRGYGAERDAELAEAMAGSGIVYVQTTRAARETAAWLARRGIASDYYHGGRRAADRERVQEAFMDGSVRVVAATNAFGLGIDKPDVRFVIHRQPPASVEQYHQEAGRAGRDGLPARCTLIHRPGAFGRAAFLAGGGRLEREEVRRAREGLLRRREGTLAELGEATGLGRADLVRLVDLLVEEGVAARRGSRVRLTAGDFDPDAIPLEDEERREA